MAGNVFLLLSSELVIFLAPYCSSMREFVGLLCVTKLIVQHGPEDKQFWEQLLNHFLRSHGMDLSAVLASFANLRSAQTASSSAYYLFKDLFAQRRCSRSGCFQTYEEWQNHPTACRYHPGRKKTRNLTCCGASGFSDRGCKAGTHSGIFHFMLHVQRHPDDKVHGSGSKLPRITGGVVGVPAETAAAGGAASISAVRLPPI